MSNKRRKAAPVDPDVGKRARLDDDWIDSHPVWCFNRLHPGRWGWRNLHTRGKLFEACDDLRTKSQLTWKQINVMPKDGHGWESGKGIDFAASWPGENHACLIFRLGQDVRMVGYRYKQAFVVIWLDSTFTLYDHG